MNASVGQHILERLADHGVERIYGYPGDGINGILGGFHEVERVEFIQAAHEELAAFMACAHAKLSGDVGVCLATSGPGAIHLLNGLYDAKLDHQPVVAIIGQQAALSLGGSYQQEVDLLSLFKDVASEYVQLAVEPGQITHLIDRAVQIARATRSVTCVIVPNDLQEQEMEEPPRAHGTIYSGGPVPSRASSPTAMRSRRPPPSSTPASAWRSSSARAPARRRTSSRRSPTCSARAWPRRSTAATSCPTTSPM